MTEKPKSKESEFYATEFRGDATLHINSYLSSIHDRSEFDDRAIYYFGIVACACKFESVMSLKCQFEPNWHSVHIAVDICRFFRDLSIFKGFSDSLDNSL